MIAAENNSNKTSKRTFELVELKMRTPALFWICAGYLVIATTVSAFQLSHSIARFLYVADKIEGIVAITAYLLGTVAFVLRRKAAIPLLATGMIVGIGGLAWAIATRGFGPNFADPLYTSTRAAAACILLAIILYGARLTKAGILL